MSYEVSITRGRNDYGVWQFSDYDHAEKFFRRVVKLGYEGRLIVW